MTLEIKHFDCRLNQWIYIDNNKNHLDSILTEKLDNTLLEAYFPNKVFSFGEIDEKCTAADLKNHPTGQVLLLSSKTRMLYGDPECLETIEKLCPDRKDRGAYGSIFLGSCHNAVTRKMNILVVNDETGENGGVLPNKIAWKQVGDCHGKISPDLAINLSSTAEKVIQYRLAIPSEYRFGKGTVAPKNLDNLPYLNDNTAKIDLIVPTSSFKGGDKKNNPIKPGLHQVEVWIGEKELSKQGKIALSQIHASYPEGIKDFLEELRKQARDLSKIQKDPRILAAYYCQKYEEKTDKNEFRELEDDDSNAQEERDELSENLIYKLIKQDLQSGHYQLLESPKVINELQRFLQKEWLEIAIAKSVKFDRAMIIPSKDLKHEEICVPWIDEDKEILNFRSPFLNSNGMCVSVNKWVEDAKNPNGNFFQGVIVCNDEDLTRIKKRIEAEKAQGINTQEAIPRETETERQGRDYDGDCIGVADASKYPNLTEEVKRRNLPENAYPPIKKEEKASFYREDGTQPSFEEIAIFMSDGISVGIINNHATAIEALESEIDIILKYGTQQQKLDYVKTVAAHYQSLIEKADNEKDPYFLPPQYEARIREIANISNNNLTSSNCQRAMMLNRSIYHDLIGEAGYQNQLAVDIFKSNRAPDLDLIRKNNKLLYRIPNYIRDKKKQGLYGKANQVIEVKGYSPVEILISQANQYFSESALVSRPLEQFSDLFPQNYSIETYNKILTAKQEFEQLFSQAVIANNKIKNESGPSLNVTTKNGTIIQITNLTKFEHPLAFKEEPLKIKLVENKNPSSYHKLIALAVDEVSKLGENQKQKTYKALGTVCEISRTEKDLKPGMTADIVQARLTLPTSERRVNLLFDKALNFAEAFYNSIPEADKKNYAAAAWHNATAPQKIEKDKKARKNSNFVFAIFGKEIVEQLSELQLKNLQLSRISKNKQSPENQTLFSLVKDSNPRDFVIKENKNESEKNLIVYLKEEEKEKPIAYLSTLGSQLPNKTQVKGIIKAENYSTVELKINHDNLKQPITYGKARDFDLSGYNFEKQLDYEIRLVKPEFELKPVIKWEGKVLGTLDKDNIKLLKEAGVYQKGKSFQVTLNSNQLHQNNQGAILATSAKGNTLKIIQVKNNQNFSFNNKIAKITLDFEAQTQQNGFAVEVKIDNNWKKAGFFTRNQSESIKALQKAGLWKEGTEVTAKLSPNYTVFKLELQPESLKYPALGEWENTSSQKKSQTQATEIVKQATYFIFKLKQKPTLLQKLDMTWDNVPGGADILPTLGIVVDNNLATQTENWLKNKEVVYQKINPTDLDVEEESKRGYTVFRIPEYSLSEELKQQIYRQVGKPLEANLIDVSTISPYYQKLESLPLKEEFSDLNKSFRFQKIISQFQNSTYSSETVSSSFPSENKTSKDGFSSPPLFSEEKLLQKHNTNQTKNLLSSEENAKFIAETIDNFLKVKKTNSFQGQNYLASKDTQSMIISLHNQNLNQLLLKAKFNNNQWEIYENSLTANDVNHFQNIAPKIQEKLEKQQAIATNIYHQIVKEVRNKPGFKNSSTKEVDLAVAITLLGKQTSQDEIVSILERSPYALDMNVKSEPNYAHKTYNKALTIKNQLRQINGKKEEINEQIR